MDDFETKMFRNLAKSFIIEPTNETDYSEGIAKGLEIAAKALNADIDFIESYKSEKK